MDKSYPALTITWTAPADRSRSDLLRAALDGTGATALEDLPHGIRAHFQRETDRDKAIAALRAFEGVAWSPSEESDDDWAARSQAAIGAVTVDDITVAPPWAAAGDARTKSRHLVIIQPSMGFGTAHHASTRLCLRLMQPLPLGGLAVLDVGTGSGVLAIAAVRLGAGVIVGIDADPDALACARENASLNGVVGRIDFREVDLATKNVPLGYGYDLVLANLTGAMLARHASTLTAPAIPGARLIASGYQPQESSDVIQALATAGWAIESDLTEDEWCGAVFRR